MLRCINMLETPSGGSILFHGKDISAKGADINQYRSRVGMVFQNFNLFSNMTVLENCVVGQTKVLGKSREEAEAVDIVRKATNSLKPDEAVEKILDLFARTRNNREFVEMAKRIRFI